VSRSRPQPPSFPVRWTWPVALLCALAYLGTAVHFSLVRHATCAAHGELVHAGTEPAHAAADRFPDARVAAADEAPDTGHGAEAHCAHALPRRELVRESPALGIAGASASVRTERVPRRAPAEPVERLHLAPKASPPRA